MESWNREHTQASEFEVSLSSLVKHCISMLYLLPQFPISHTAYTRERNPELQTTLVNSLSHFPICTLNHCLPAAGVDVISLAHTVTKSIILITYLNKII